MSHLSIYDVQTTLALQRFLCRLKVLKSMGHKWTKIGWWLNGECPNFIQFPKRKMHKNARYKPVIDQNDQTNHIIMFIIGSRHWQLTIMVLPMDMPWPTHVAQRHDMSTWDWTTLKNQQAAWWFLQGFIEPRAASQGTNCILELLQESLRGRKFSRSGYVCRRGNPEYIT